MTSKFYLYIGQRLDLLDVMIQFIKMLESSDNDPLDYVDGIEETKLKLEILSRTQGKNYKKATQSIQAQSEGTPNWTGMDQYRENAEIRTELDTMALASAKCFLDNFTEMFSDDRLNSLQEFRVLSMKSFRREVGSASHVDDFGKEYLPHITDKYCSIIRFRALWKEPAEERNQVLSALPLFSQTEFEQQYDSFKLYIFLHFMQENRQTKETYTTKEVLTVIINENPPWIQQGTALRKFVDHYRLQAITSIAVERLFSAFTYLDTAVVQQRNPDNTERIIRMYKELPAEEVFDLRTATFIWKKYDARRTVLLPPVNEFPTPNKHLIKHMDEIQKARGKRNTFMNTNRETLYDEENYIDFEAETPIQELIEEEPNSSEEEQDIGTEQHATSSPSDVQD